MPVAVLVTMVLTVPVFANPDEWRRDEWPNTDFSKTNISLGQIVSGGPPKDGIPAIDKPNFLPLGEVSELGAREPLIALEINGEQVGYPLRILMWHEIVNDVVGGVPVVVTYCPLCNTSIVFERKIGERVYDFGTTGKLRHSDLVMYDRQTESWWQQFTGRAIVGEMVGRKLKGVASRLISFEKFKATYSRAKILAAPKGSKRKYGFNPYAGYDTSQMPFLYQGSMPIGVSPMARVVAFETSTGKRAVSLHLLRSKLKMLVGDVMLSWEAGQNSVLDKAEIQTGRDVGNVIAQAKVNGVWRDIQYEVTFAFAFHAFHPKASIQTE